MTSHLGRNPRECEEFQKQLPELLGEGQDLSNIEHLKTCETCAALVRDLEYIAAQAKLLLPIHDPSPSVWEHIHSALAKETESSGEGS
jgi:hypothetical protein